MKVICIKEESGYHLTKNRIYDVHPANSSMFDYVVINDKGIEHFVESDIFRNLDEVREEKIKIIFNI